MDRPEFEALRDLPDKVIVEDIRFSKKKNLSPCSRRRTSGSPTGWGTTSD